MRCPSCNKFPSLDSSTEPETDFDLDGTTVTGTVRTREYWEAKYGAGNVWSPAELTEAFTVHMFSAPYVIVTRKSDGVRGLLQFAHSPWFYFNFRPEGPSRRTNR